MITITTVDNRKAYREREKATRMDLPLDEFTVELGRFAARQRNGHKFQHNLRIEREVKRRKLEGLNK